MRFKPYPYQQHAIDWIIEHPAAGLLLDMGLGKTVITLSAIAQLKEAGLISKVLVVAPLRVAATVWAEEIDKWDHLQGIKAVKVLGCAETRKRRLQEEADIYIINRENIPWLWMQLYKHWPFDMVVLDELSSFKSAGSERFRAMKRARKSITRIVGLTGTPAPNGLMDLWSQIYLLDEGKRLGKTITGYRQRYFTEGRRNATVVYEWRPKPMAAEAVYDLIGDICISMTAEDYLQLPQLHMVTWPVSLSPRASAAYKRLEADLVLPYADQAITAQSAAVLSGKLLQLANGAVYSDDGSVIDVHDGKLDALEDIIEAANGHPVLVYYGYKHDLSRIMKRLPQSTVLKSADDVKRWNAGEIPLLLAHPDSAGHGLNLQAGGSIMVWFGLTWSLEKYQQANARLYRQGQQKPVTIYHIATQGTLDEQVMQALESKEDRQDMLIEAVKARVDRR